VNKPVAIVVEDDEILAELLGILVGLAGYQAETLLDGLKASARLGSSDLPRPNLVVLDLHLPGMGGGELLKQIRSDPQLVDTAAVILTADIQAQAVYHPGAAGTQPDHLLIKPVDNEVLQSVFGKYKEGRSKAKD
jgi:CheY-like chemotaxis protein